MQAILVNESMDEMLRICGDSSCSSMLRQTSCAANMFVGPTGSLHPSFAIDGYTDAVKVRAMIGNAEDTLYAYPSSESLFFSGDTILSLETCLGVSKFESRSQAQYHFKSAILTANLWSRDLDLADCVEGEQCRDITRSQDRSKPQTIHERLNAKSNPR